MLLNRWLVWMKRRNDQSNTSIMEGLPSASDVKLLVMKEGIVLVLAKLFQILEHNT